LFHDNDVRRLAASRRWVVERSTRDEQSLSDMVVLSNKTGMTKRITTGHAVERRQKSRASVGTRGHFGRAVGTAVLGTVMRLLLRCRCGRCRCGRLRCCLLGGLTDSTHDNSNESWMAQGMVACPIQTTMGSLQSHYVLFSMVLSTFLVICYACDS
jgi:hypothetical protein